MSFSLATPWTRRFTGGVAGGTLLLVFFGWLATGTLAMYAIVSSIAVLWPPCGYVVNTDHGHFVGAFLMLDGAPRQYWEWSVVLRRTLYPLLAYPWMKWLGVEYGGILFNFVLTALSAVGFTVFLRRRVGEGGALAALLLLALYPGVHYWIGLPYSYAAIVPACLAAGAILWRLEQSERWGEALGLALTLGIVFLAYDLWPFFLPAAAALLWLRFRRVWVLGVGLALAVAPMVVNLLVLKRVYGLPLSNSNTDVYVTVVRAWLAPADLAAWGSLLLGAPLVFVQNLLASNFFFLPALFLAVWLGWAWRNAHRLLTWEKAVLLAALSVWLFNNLAPPYPGKWQMRGAWIARLYQPIFVVYLSALARWLPELWTTPVRRRWVGAALAATLAANGLVMAGPWLWPMYTSRISGAFYWHDPPEVMVENLKVIGARPLGFCAVPRRTGP